MKKQIMIFVVGVMMVMLVSAIGINQQQFADDVYGEYILKSTSVQQSFVSSVKNAVYNYPTNDYHEGRILFLQMIGEIVPQSKLTEEQVALQVQEYQGVFQIIPFENDTITRFFTGIMTEHIYTESKTIEDGVDYVAKLNDKEKLKNKQQHYAYALLTDEEGNTYETLDVEERLVVLEGAYNQMWTILCDKGILKKGDGCL